MNDISHESLLPDNPRSFLILHSSFLIHRVLSVRQPWAWLLVMGWKNIENRTWTTKYRGTLMIHASQSFDRAGYLWVKKEFPVIQMPGINKFQRGGIIGAVNLDDVVDDAESPWAEDGLKHWKVSNAQTLPFFKCNGSLNLWTLSSAQIEAFRHLLVS